MVQALRCAVHNIQALKIFQDIMETESQNVCPKKFSSYETVPKEIYRHRPACNETVIQGRYKK
jgi:hypothetical protein